jgi:hypothetical protein
LPDPTLRARRRRRRGRHKPGRGTGLNLSRVFEPPERDIASRDLSNELRPTCGRLRLVANDLPGRSVVSGDHLDVSVREVRGVDTTAELEGSGLVGHHEGGVVQVGHGQDRGVMPG